MADTTTSISIVRHATSFQTIDGTSLSGFFYPAAATAPIIILTHGLTLLIEHYLDVIAAAFQAAGYAALIYDQRPAWTQDVIPYTQVSDLHDAITFVTSSLFPYPGTFNASKLALWGFSYAGGHSIQAAASDRRVKAVLALCPVVSGKKARDRILKENPAAIDIIGAMIWGDRAKRMAGEAPTYIPVITKTPETEFALFDTKEAYDFFTTANVTRWVNRVTLQTVFDGMDYIPEASISSISPTPLLMIVGKNDVNAYMEDQEGAFEMAKEPKEWHALETDHWKHFTDKKLKAEILKIELDFLKEHFGKDKA
ncbi:alpha/beta-hydrolase [Wilcoxina mikolae CBS 423.85]|nr:alpha/beta-hydrolase [Wilcoxina mikolae CBS 423.85]